MTVPFQEGDEVLPGAARNFGLEKDYGKKKNAKALCVSAAKTAALKEMYRLGTEPGASKKSAATTLEELQESVILRLWVDRVILTETLIKRKYRERFKADKLSAKVWAQKKGQKKSGKAEVGEIKEAKESKDAEVGEEEGKRAPEKDEEECEQEMFRISSLDMQWQNMQAAKIADKRQCRVRGV